MTVDDALVVGGGVVGLAAAYELATAGLRVRLVERRHPGAGASTVAAGILTPTDLDEWVGVRGRLHVRALEAWPAYAERIAAAAGGPVGFRRCGSLRVDAGDHADGAWLASSAQAMRDLGVPVEPLDDAGCRELVPALAEVRGGVFAPTDGAVDTGRLVEALALAATGAGVAIEVDEVVGLRRRGDRVEGVELAVGGARSAAATVVAAGAWTGAAAWLPAVVRPALLPVGGDAVLAAGPPGLLGTVVRTARGSVAPRDGGRLWLGTSVRPSGVDPRPNVGQVAALLGRLLDLLPALADAELSEVRAGARPVSADGLPHVGATALDGLLLATGHGREGILHAPLVAEVIAATVRDGVAPPWAAPLLPRASG